MMGSKSDAVPPEDRLSDAATLPNKTKADYLKTINPSRKTLSSLEAKLIFGVLYECIHQMEIVSLLPTLLSSPEALSQSLGEEVVHALKEHQRLGEKYQAMVLDASFEQSELKEQLAKSTKAVQDSFHNIMRLLMATPTTREVLKGIEPNTGGEMETQKLKDGLCELREIVLERLLTTPAEERERREMMLEVSLRHSANQDSSNYLDIFSLLHQLRNSLHQMEKGLEDFIVRTQQDAEKQSQSDTKTSEGKGARLQQEASQLRSQLNNVTEEDRERELALRKERQEAQKQRKQQEREREMQSQAATVIQAHWRGFCVRKAMKANAKPKKGKKGKGKKGK
uniref:Dynein regulatory complex protein 10 n=1 Tax=Sinocyclocheilus anshuiensis TaxID=1608454 RepID=A0A671MTK8_9TELE